MQAVRVHPNNSNASPPYSEKNPAPLSAIHVDREIPIPQPTRAGELLVRVRATTVIRDALTWPETYLKEYTILGHDFAGTVVSVYGQAGDLPFKSGDEVYGMVHASRGGTWADYAVVTVEEACLKPKRLTWAEAAAVPLSGLTAYQALFEKAGVPPLDLGDTHKTEQRRLLVTGAAGGVGTYAVQLAKLAGLYVVAATSSNSQNKELLEQLGADEVVEYADLTGSTARYHIIIDTVGGKPLEHCWTLVNDNGTLISIDSASFNFVEQHRKSGLVQQKDKVKALFFIVTPSREGLEQLSKALESSLLVPFVRSVLPLGDVRSAYSQSAKKSTERGKIVLIPQ
jgi:NADPH:quinone reductase-like Zn-dependent oxidoreductase